MNINNSEILAELKQLSQPGNKLAVAAGLDTDGDCIAIKFACDKADCDCIGHWETGNSEYVERWIFINEI